MKFILMTDLIFKAYLYYKEQNFLIQYPQRNKTQAIEE